MKDNTILNKIKNKDLEGALMDMENLCKNFLIKKLGYEFINENIDFIELINVSIKKFPQYYEILTYLRNIYFFSDKTDYEKLYELANIYENLVEY